MFDFCCYRTYKNRVLSRPFREATPPPWHTQKSAIFPPGKVWADFIQRTDELVVLAEGEIEIEIEGKSEQPPIGEEVFIPANAMHTVRNVGKANNVWYYGYKNT